MNKLNRSITLIAVVALLFSVSIANTQAGEVFNVTLTALPTTIALGDSAQFTLSITNTTGKQQRISSIELFAHEGSGSCEEIVELINIEDATINAMQTLTFASDFRPACVGYYYGIAVVRRGSGRATNNRYIAETFFEVE